MLRQTDSSEREKWLRAAHAAVECADTEHDLTLNVGVKHLPWQQPRKLWLTDGCRQQTVRTRPDNEN